MSIYKGKQKEIKRLRNKVMLFWSYSYNIFQNNACKNALFFSFKKTSNCSILSIELTFKSYMSHQKIRSTSTMQKRWSLRLYANLLKNMYILLKYVYMYILLLNLSSHLNSTWFWYYRILSIHLCNSINAPFNRTAQKKKFSVKDFLVNVSKSTGNWRISHIYWRNP